jgi:hypothetical protein
MKDFNLESFFWGLFVACIALALGYIFAATVYGGPTDLVIHDRGPTTVYLLKWRYDNPDQIVIGGKEYYFDVYDSLVSLAIDVFKHERMVSFNQNYEYECYEVNIEAMKITKIKSPKICVQYEAEKED